MASTSHDILVFALREEPSLLGELVERLVGCGRGRRIGAGLQADDSAVRFAKASEVRPDLVLRGPKGSWALVEVQQRIDRRKRRRWPLAASILFDQRRVMGDVVVITSSRAVARWAGRAANVRGPFGTELVLRPVVVLIGDREIDLLLNDQRPTLALFAAWAVRGRRGRKALDIVRRALEVTDRLDEPLRDDQTRAILEMVGDEMNEFLKKLHAHPEILPRSRGLRQFEAFLRAEGRAEGQREALLQMCAARGVRLGAVQRSRVLACRDLRTLERWIRRAAVADSAASVFRVRPSSRQRRSNGRRRPENRS